jgi:hypothetical protein
MSYAMSALRAWVWLMTVALVACHDRAEVMDGADAGVIEIESTGEFEGLPYGRDQWNRLCAKQYGDAISAKFCAGDAPPGVFSLVDLIKLLNSGTSSPPLSTMIMTGLSTGIGVRTVTPFNPRAFVMTSPSYGGWPKTDYMVITFARGEPLVELVANDPAAQTLRFFVLRFHPACESTPTGCNWADLLTPTIESGWTAYTLYDDDTLKNSTIDCLSCHQPDGPGTPKILRMQELTFPWKHWFDIGAPGLDEFFASHVVDEVYAGGQFPRNAPNELQDLLVINGFVDQPNRFDSTTIDDELFRTGASPTWQALYDNAVAGLAIPPPYYGDLHTDLNKLGPMITAYTRVMNGTLARELLPDVRDTLRDSALADMSIRPKPGLDGRGILVHMCGRCHNSRLDQSLTRARFNVETLDTLSRAEKDSAIERLRLPDNHRSKMPPVRFHTLSAAERDLVIEELQK